MLQSIVACSGHATTCRTFRSLRTSELHFETEKRKRRIFDDSVVKNLGDLVTIPTSPNARDYVLYSDGVDLYYVQFPGENDLVMPDGTDVFDKTITDQWINSDLTFPQGELLW